MEKQWNFTIMSQTKFLFIVLSFGLLSFEVYAQDKLPLSDLLAQLETKFDIKFSYSVNDVKQVRVGQPHDSATLVQIINQLNANTNLNFEFLDERYIAVSVNNKNISICGIVYAENLNTPLFGATIAVTNSSNGTVTDVNGKFELKDLSANALVSISYLGFTSQTISAYNLRISNNGCTTIILQEHSQVLNQVFISKFLTTGLQKLIDGSTILNTEKFGILPGLTDPDVLQSIQALPGVESVNESIANINVRGGTNDQNLILWDGIKMYHAGHFFGLISAYNPHLTNSVVVTKNGTSSEYSDGVSSTINMSTKNEIGSELSGGFGANLIHADAFLEIPVIDRLGLHLSGRRSFTDFINSPTYNNYYDRSFQDSKLSTTKNPIDNTGDASEFYFYDYTAKLLYDLNDSHKFRANYIGISNQLEFKEPDQNDTEDNVSKTSILKQENIGFGAHWDAIWNTDFSSSISAFYSRYNVDAIDYNIDRKQQLTQANEVLETGVKIKTNYKFSNHLNFLNGYQFSEIGVLNGTTVNAPSYVTIKKDVLLNHALFSEVEYNNKTTYLRVGVRSNYFQKFARFIIEPRLNFKQKLNSHLALKLQGEFKNQSVNQSIDFEYNFLGIEKRRWVLADDITAPISESKQGSFGLEFHNNNWLIDVEGFYKHVDGITTSNQGFYNNYQFINAKGSHTSKGVELLLNKTERTYSAWLSYTFSTNNYYFQEFNPSKFPHNVDVRHSISMAINVNVLKNLEISIGGIWRSGSPYTKPLKDKETVKDGNTYSVNYDSPNRENLDDFMRFDASLHFQTQIAEKVRAIIRAGVINITNKTNVTNRYFKVNADNLDTTVQVDHNSLGLTPNLSLRINF
ncbi:TonB-dependent receptor-like protein [Gelidibacter sediminis]|uniref:TonB-dependent receptor-like protein n=2 Tax=Gelidibacter sediminis TaxID=1608710 RepID=A0A4R7PZ60_9FLAO|nr:TonB-dependent receptor-like protein [Gelidibacter sediminis]